jgi:ankyrin repeat protein
MEMDLLQRRLNDALINACELNDLERVKFLLTSNQLPIHAQINYKDSDGIDAIITASKNNHTRIVKYLLSSSDLQEHSNIHSADDLPLFFALIYSNNELLSFYIKDMNIERNENVEKHLKQYMNAFIEKLLLAQELNNILTVCKEEKKLVKI